MHLEVGEVDPKFDKFGHKFGGIEGVALSSVQQLATAGGRWDGGRYELGCGVPSNFALFCPAFRLCPPREDHSLCAVGTIGPVCCVAGILCVFEGSGRMGSWRAKGNLCEALG